MNKKIPQHVAIVMDGNGRWAENHGLPRAEGHRAGIKAVKQGIQFCLEKEISILSLFAFSSENWLRPELEINFLMKLFIRALKQEVDSLHEHGVCIQFTGDRCQLSSELQEQMQKAELLTSANKQLILNIAVNYSGKWDLLQAVKKISSQVSQGILSLDNIDEALLSSNLATGDLREPDLLIRTSGEQRISNFFLWQLAYTELYFTPVYWPDFNATEFEKALACYSARERRYGQTSKQLHETNHV